MVELIDRFTYLWTFVSIDVLLYAEMFSLVRKARLDLLTRVTFNADEETVFKPKSEVTE